MKIYLLDDKGKKSKNFINVSYWSFLKAYSLGWLGFISIVMAIILFISLLVF